MVLTLAYLADDVLGGSAEVNITKEGVAAATRGSPKVSRQSPERFGKVSTKGGENGSDAMKISKRWLLFKRGTLKAETEQKP